MSQLSRRAMQRGLGAPATTSNATAIVARRIPCAAQSRWFLTGKKAKDLKPLDYKPSFRGQLVESITARLARERAEEAAAGEARQNRRKGENWAMTFGKPETTTIPLSSVTPIGGLGTCRATVPLTRRPFARRLQSSSARASSPSTAEKSTRATSGRSQPSPSPRR